MKRSRLYTGGVVIVGLGLLLSLSLDPDAWRLARVEDLGLAPWLVFSLLATLGCAAALLGFRYRGEFVSLDTAIGLAALYLYGPVPAGWILVLSRGARIVGRGRGRFPFPRSGQVFELGTRPLMALFAGSVYLAAGGRYPLQGLDILPGWKSVDSAGWGPVLAAALAFYLAQELFRLPRRLRERDELLDGRQLLSLEAPLLGAKISLGVVLALCLGQQGLLAAILVAGLVLFACRAFQGMVENREDLTQRIQEMRSLNMVGRAICSTMQPDDLMAVIYRECRRLLDTSLFYVALHDAEENVLRMELLAEGDEVLEGSTIPLSKGFSGFVYRTRRPLCFRSRREMQDHPAYVAAAEVGRIRCESYLWVPIATRDRVFGVLSAQHVEQDRYGEDTLHAMQAIARQAAVALDNIHLFRKATTDSLTGLYLRTYFEQKLEEQIFKARRHGYRLSLMVIDLDDFKNINDTMGHAAGDEVLREVGQAIGHSIRAQDVAARYGGDEFVLMLPGINVENCLDVAARIKSCVQALNFPVLARMGTSRITVSIGIATVAPGEQTDLASLFDTADQALYEAKRTGKNRVLARGNKAS